MQNFRDTLINEARVSKKALGEWKGFIPEPKDQMPLFCDECSDELFMHYFYSFKFRPKEGKQTFLWFCQTCTMNFLKKDKRHFPHDVVAFRRYDEQKLSSFMERATE